MIEPSFWETSRGMWLIVVMSIIVGGSLGGLLGYWLGSMPPREIIVHIVKSTPETLK